MENRSNSFVDANPVGSSVGAVDGIFSKNVGLLVGERDGDSDGDSTGDCDGD